MRELVLAVLMVAAATGASAEEPANLCQEFLTFMQAPEPPFETARPAQTPPQGERSAQELTGQSGPAVEAPKPVPAPVPLGTGQSAPQTSGLAAPVPVPPGQSTPKHIVVTPDDAEQLAAKNDVLACRAAVQQLRREGVAVPPDLLALAALDSNILQSWADQKPVVDRTP